jgi:hypothetical protein
MSRLRYQGDATFEQIIDFLAMTLVGGVTPTTPGGGTLPRDWTFTPDLEAANIQDSYTFEYGDDTQAWESAFVTCVSMDLGINLGAVVSLGAELVGRFAEKTTFTGSLTDPSVEEVVGDGARFFLDTSWAGIGGTEYDAMLAGGSIRLNSGLVPVRYADGLDSNGRANFSTLIENKRSHGMDLDLIISSDMITNVYDKFASGTSAAIRIVFDLAANSIETSFNHELEIDMFGKFEGEPEIFGERDGENLVRMQFVSYDDGNGNELTVRVRNSLTAL